MFHDMVAKKKKKKKKIMLILFDLVKKIAKHQ